MARQSTAPVSFSRSTRKDEGVLMSSGRAGVVTPILIIPALKGDSVSGQVAIDVSLAEMPKPLRNPVFANVQAWFVPKAAFPQFSGTDEFLNSYTETTITALGAADRTPPPYFRRSGVAEVLNSDHLKTLGIHVPAGEQVNMDYVDAFNLVYNFRLAAHSSKLARKKYMQEVPAEAVAFPPAFWPSGRFAHVVPDYEKALVVGSLDLDISAGKLPVHNLIRVSGTGTNPGTVSTATRSNDNSVITPTPPIGDLRNIMMHYATAENVWAEMAGETVTASLADIDKARTTQAFAKLRTSMAGNDTSGFISDEMVLAYLMQGISVPPEYFRRPWLLAQQRVAFGFSERHAMDGASLDQSSTTGRASVRMNLNVPNQDVGGYIVATIEVLPERLDERQTDEAWLIGSVDQLPNALRDVQRVEPVDTVMNRRLDAKHTSPLGLYGYEPMNKVWDRSFTKLGGIFYQPDPAAPVTESRSAIWQAGIIDPLFNEDHYLAPVPFPHDVFADTQAPAFEMVIRHSAQIVGLTQIGDVLAEDNDDFGAVEDGGISDGIEG